MLFFIFLFLPTEQGVRALLSRSTGTISLPAGRVSVRSEIKLPDGSHELTIQGNGTTLVAAPDFRGRALLSCKRCRNLTVTGLKFNGNRAALEMPVGLPPGNVPFSEFYDGNGVLLQENTGVRLEHDQFTDIVNFAVLVYRSAHVAVTDVSVTNSGSRNAKGRNNTSGGVLLEEGTNDFLIADSVFRNIRGNGAWTHAYSRSPRNLHGKIVHNDFTDIGRDAIQIGHASDVTVAGNTGRRIGFMLDEVDLESMGTPVAIDTAGNVDRSTYEGNHFEEVDGKCIDLDGFHDGVVRGNTCVNHGKVQDYPFGNFGIALNNTSIAMEPKNILIEGNTLDGMKDGGIFVVGSGHRIVHNTMRNLNRLHCNDAQGKEHCIVILDEPGFLESGIYLSAHGNRPAGTTNVTIEDNLIQGWNMSKYCIRAAPGVSLAGDHVQRNRCQE